MNDAPEPLRRPKLPQPPADGSYAYQTEVTITPAFAQTLIAANADNQRFKKPQKISGYASDMKAQPTRWRAKTGESIKVSQSGYLIDGQNRMHAVVESDTPAVFDIAWNVPDRNIEVIDGNTPRSLGDRFRIHGATDSFAVGPPLRWIIAIEHGNPMLSGYGYLPTHTEMQERYQADAGDIDAAVARGLDLRRSIRGANAGAASTAYYLFMQADKVAADLYWEKLVTGANIAPGNPIHAMRDRFVGPTGRYLNRKEQLALVIRAFNGWTANEALATIQLPRNGLNNFTFPKVKVGGFPDGVPEADQK